MNTVNEAIFQIFLVGITCVLFSIIAYIIENNETVLEFIKKYLI
jgi:hypothetical protein